MDDRLLLLEQRRRAGCVTKWPGTRATRSQSEGPSSDRLCSRWTAACAVMHCIGYSRPQSRVNQQTMVSVASAVTIEPRSCPGAWSLSLAATLSHGQAKWPVSPCVAQVRHRPGTEATILLLARSPSKFVARHLFYPAAGNFCQGSLFRSTGFARRGAGGWQSHREAGDRPIRFGAIFVGQP